MAKNYKDAGRADEAARCLNQLIESYPNTKWAEEAREALKQLGP
jgi:outer membrane protein assembly factor BamD (BamD/ComL family)